MTHEELVTLATNELKAFAITQWDSRAFESFKEISRKAVKGIEDKNCESVWRDAILKMKEEQPGTYEKYLHRKRQKFATPAEVIEWKNVECLGGVTSGDTITLRFRVGTVFCTLEGSDEEFFNPTWVQRKLQAYTCQAIAFPFTPKERDLWVSGAVIPWLNKKEVKRSEQKTRSDILLDTLRAYCFEPIHAENNPDAWGATGRAVFEDGTYFVTYAGFTDFVRRRTGSEHQRSVSNLLVQASIDGERFQKRTKRGREWFYRIKKETLYDTTIDPSSAGVGEDNTTGQPGAGDFESAWKRIDDELREEEHRENDSGRGLPQS